MHKKLNLQNTILILQFNQGYKFPKSFKMLKMYYFIQSGEITLHLSSGKKIMLKKNYSFSVEELIFLNDFHARVAITKEAKVIGVPFSILKELGIKTEKWLFRNIGLYFLSSHPFFKILKRQTLIKFSKELDYQFFRSNEWGEDVILTNFKEKADNMMQKYGSSSKFKVTEAQSEFIFVLRGELEYKRQGKGGMKKNSPKPKTSFLDSFNHDSFTKGHKIVHYSKKIDGTVRISQYPTVIARVNIYKTARILNDEFEFINQEIKNGAEIDFEDEVDFDPSKLVEILNLGVDCVGVESLSCSSQTKRIYYLRKLLKEDIKKISFENQILVFFSFNFYLE